MTTKATDAYVMNESVRHKEQTPLEQAYHAVRVIAEAPHAIPAVRTTLEPLLSPMRQACIVDNQRDDAVRAANEHADEVQRSLTDTDEQLRVQDVRVASLTTDLMRADRSRRFWRLLTALNIAAFAALWVGDTLAARGVL